MWQFNRRLFIGSSVAAVAGMQASSSLLPAEEAQKKVPDIKIDKRSGPNTLFLTWQSDPCTTMTIQWLGAATKADVAIRYSEIAETTWKTAATSTKPYPETEFFVFRCELTGLKPGSEYKFQIGSDLAAYRFRTMPARIIDEFRFITGGDAGIGEAALRTNRLAALQNPNFVLIMGDLAYDNGNSPDVFATFLKNYRSTMVDSSGRLIPLLAGIGNHEVQGGFKAKREKATSYLSFFDGLYAEQTYGVVDFGDYLSLVLADTGHVAPVAGEQTSWMQQTLAARQELPHLIVANHVPAFPSYREPQGEDSKLGTGEEQRIHWCPLFERYKVDVVLEHHDHTFKRTLPLTDGRYDKHGLVYLGDGSWGKLRVPKTPEQRPYLAKIAQAYHLTVHSLQGDQRFHMAIEDTGRIADIHASFQKRPSRRG